MRKSKQYCLNGHDTYVVGRAPNRQCRECLRARQRARSAAARARRAPARASKPKTHCRNGHEYATGGRYANGRCKTCVTNDYKRRRGEAVEEAFNDWDAPEYGVDGARLAAETRYRLHERKFFREVWGMSDPQISERLGVAPGAMRQILKSAGLAWVPAPESEEVAV